MPDDRAATRRGRVVRRDRHGAVDGARRGHAWRARRAGEQAARPEQRGRQEHEVSGEELVGRADLVAERLRDTQDDPADEGPPQRAEPADDDRLEREDQPDRPVGGAEVVRIPRKTPADRRPCRARSPCATAYRWRSSIPTRRAARRSSDVARSARPSWVRAEQSSCRPPRMRDGHDEREQREDPDRDLVGDGGCWRSRSRRRRDPGSRPRTRRAARSGGSRPARR